MPNPSTVKPIYLRLLILSLIILGLTFLSRINLSQAGSLESVSVTMDNSRLSFRGKVDAVEGTIVTIEVDDDFYTDYTNGDADATDVLKVGDELYFITEEETREILEVVDGETIILDEAVDMNDFFYLAEESVLTVEFTTRTDVLNGAFQVLVPAADSDHADGVPDQGYFDFNTGSPDVTCTGDGHTFDPAISTAGGSDYGGETWHEYTCPYTDGDNNVAITITIDNVVNPGPAADHQTGWADTHDIIVRHLEQEGEEEDPEDGDEVDATKVKVGVIEAVRVSATVEPSLTFRIYGESENADMCGTTSDVETLPNSVPFGSLNVTTFTYASQILDVATNAVDGAAVTALAYDQLGRNGEACEGKVEPGDPMTDYDCIWDADVTGMSHEDEADWSDENTETGFGYSLHNYEGRSNPAFNYDDGTPSGIISKHFADYDRGGAGEQSPQLLFNTDGDPTNQADAKVCYIISLDSITAAGEYYTFITYTATATF